MMKNYYISILLLCVLCILYSNCYKAVFKVDPTVVKEIPFDWYNITEDTRYLLYDVNIGEGTNLRRAIYVRVGNLIKRLRKETGENWILVLPEWRGLFHWQSKQLQQGFIPWGQYFDIRNMNLYIPVMEFSTYWFNEGYKNGIDYVLYLKYPEDFRNRTQITNMAVMATECNPVESESYLYKDEETNVWRGYMFFMRKEVFARKRDCLNYIGNVDYFTNFVKNNLTGYRSIYFDHMEKVTTFHREDVFEKDQVRRSLVISKHLRQEADKYRAEFLDSFDIHDKTIYIDEDYRLQTTVEGDALGGPYIGVHMRLNDWKNAHKAKIPTRRELADEINIQLDKYDLSKVYVATDGTNEEVAELQSYITNGTIYRYPNNMETAQKYSDMGIAIMDQWICAHARYFIGTCGSTFTYRIQEERDILGFHHEMTYGTCVCGKQAERCTKRTRKYNQHEVKQIGEKRLKQANELIQKSKQGKHIEL